ncbi:ATP-binding protein [Cellulosilyticum ruminicola]|uniref:ATP-binding protein n=1 Tax=Cellulosilyticum ruminicola TaxID=425254 RepID=UPI000A5DF263|nr:ATP-binding protein [Cellulosilyticum ruminicola]
MKLSIQMKIVMIYLCTIIIIMLISGTFIVYSTEERDYKSIQSEMEQLTESIATRYEWDLKEEDTDEILKEYLNLTNGKSKIYRLDNTGRVDWGTSNAISEGTTVAQEVVIRAINTKEFAMAPINHFGSMLNGRRETDCARPILNEKTGSIIAIIYVVTDIKSVYENMERIMGTIATSLVASMFIMIVFGIFFSRMITMPIKTLTMSAKKLAKGNSIKRISVEANDEIGELTQSFNYMAMQLGNTMEAITSEKNKLEKIFEHMADGVMAFNRQGELIHVNSVCYDMIGVLNMGYRFEPIFENIDAQIDFEKILLGQSDDTLEKMVIVNDKYLNMHFDVYLNAKQEPDGLVVVIQDVTKQQKLDEMRKEFVANVSHELRTPLTTVKSYTETLMDGAIEDKDMAMHFLNVMDKEADRMTALVHDLLELSRIDNRQIQLNFSEIDMKAMMDEVLEAQSIHIEKNGHRLIYSVDTSEDFSIYGDSTRIKQVLHNIMSNAIKYSIDPGTLTVSLKKEAEKIIFQIADTGIGIPKEDLKRIFERFYRVDKARSRKLGGTGLGLSIAKELVELHGGNIRIESEFGEGTTVTISFPKYRM